MGARKGADVVWLDILEPDGNLNPRYATRRKSREVGAPDKIRTCDLCLRRITVVTFRTYSTARQNILNHCY